MTLKGNGLTTYEGVKENDVDSFFQSIHTIDPSLEHDALISGDLRKSVKFTEFAATHCKATQYTFQIRKCLEEKCTYCQNNPKSLPPDVSVDLHFLPCPMLSSGNSYKSFEEAYGTATTEKDRPSLGDCGDKTTDEAFKQLLTAEKYVL